MLPTYYLDDPHPDHMLATKNAKDIKYIIIKKPEEGELCCPVCGQQLQWKYNGGKRYLVTLEGVHSVTFQYYECKNDRCTFKKKVKAPAANIIPGIEYGTVVLMFILKERCVFSQTPEQIVRRLEEYHGLQISISEVYELINAEETIMKKASVQNARERVKKKGEVLLAIDGVTMGRTGVSFYMFRDVLTDSTLAVKHLVPASADNIAEVINQIKEDFDVPIIGVVSDLADNIINAVRKALPDVPHQYCLFHFLKNVAAPMKQLDSAVASEIGQELANITSVKTLEKKKTRSRIRSIPLQSTLSSSS